MAGRAQSLTVTYGSFSCTLEGFDDPVATVKEVAGYFRTLLAEDPAFGAVAGLSGDDARAEATRVDLGRHVAARLQDRGIVLREAQASTGKAPQDGSQVPDDIAVAEVIEAVMGPQHHSPTDIEMAPVLMDAETADVAEDEHLADQPQDDAAWNDPLPVMQDVPADVDWPAATPADAESGAVLALVGAPSALAEADDTAPRAALVQDWIEDSLEDTAPEPAALQDKINLPQAEPEPEMSIGWARDDAVPLVAAVSPQGDAGLEGAEAEEPDAPMAAGIPGDAMAVADQPQDAAPALPPVDPMPVVALVAEPPVAPTESVPDETAADEQTEAPAAPLPQAEVAQLVPVAPVIAPPPAPVAREPADQAAPETAEVTLSPWTMDSAQRARARALRFARTDADTAERTTPPAAPGIPAQPEMTPPPLRLTPSPVLREVTAPPLRLSPALREMTSPPTRREMTTPPQGETTSPPQRETTARQPLTQPEEQAAVARLIATANTQLQGPESQRRLSAIAHLKAAVAATVAERRNPDAPPEKDDTQIDAFRSDLDRMVRPRRPGEITVRPMPLPSAAELMAASGDGGHVTPQLARQDAMAVASTLAALATPQDQALPPLVLESAAMVRPGQARDVTADAPLLLQNPLPSAEQPAPATAEAPLVLSPPPAPVAAPPAATPADLDSAPTAEFAVAEPAAETTPPEAAQPQTDLAGAEPAAEAADPATWSVPPRLTGRAMQLALDDEDDTGSALPTPASADFAAFAQRMGATSLSDMIEAAAAYAVVVQGQPAVSRRQVMRQLSAAMPGGPQPGPEEVLRVIGRLMNEGRIEKTGRGEFALREGSQVLNDARRLAD